jgi:hypothetical protein
VACLRPAAAGNYAQWTPNYGTNWGNVSDQYPDGDLTFNAATVAGKIDTFVMQDTPFSAGVISAIQHVAYIKQDAGAGRTFRPKTRIAGADYNGTTVSMPGSYVFNLEVANVDPSITGSWVIASLDAAEFGYELVS